MLLLSFLILGMIAGLLAGLLGIGGGIIIMPGLIYLFELKHTVVSNELMRLALGSSLASVSFISLVTMMTHAKQNTIRWPVAKQLIPGLLLGALVGSFLANHLNTQWLMWIFSAFLAILSLRYIFNWHRHVTYPFPKTPVMWLAGTLMGSLTSMLGLGGGVLIVPFLSCLPLTLREVSALSIVCILPVASLATIVYIVLGFNNPDLPTWTTGYVYWPAVLAITASSIIFAPIGIEWAKRISTDKLKKFFGLFLLWISISLLLT